jgi:trans-2,3-dihydro-3-hydroxyanthranilate isomerase
MIEQATVTDTVDFILVDVFADRSLQGNPVAIVPDAARLSEAQMHRIAREFNQSETVFILPPTGAADWRLRSFTAAGKEASGAGHHTLGTWWWLAESGVLTLADGPTCFTQEDRDGTLQVTVTRSAGRLVSVGMAQRPLQFGAICQDVAALASALSLDANDVATDHLPAQVVSTGAPHLLVPVRDRSAVDRARPDAPRLAAVLRDLDGEGCYLFSRDTVDPEAIAYTRFFNPTLGIVEDVATGTAAGPLAAQFVKHGLADRDSILRIEQGHAMGRPSVIQVRVSDQAVTIFGRCVTAGRGTLRLD